MVLASSTYNGHMRVGILLSGRFPTEKAYGVTTNGTIKSLIGLGHEVIVIGLSSLYVDNETFQDHYSLVHYRENYLSKFLKFLAFGNGKYLNKVAWYFYWQVTKYLNKKLILSHNLDLLWIRDPHMLNFSFASQEIILEVHQKFKVRRYVKSLKKVRSKKIIIAPISKVLLDTLIQLTDSSNLVYSPMGVNTEIISKNEEVVTFISSLRSKLDSKLDSVEVGYVGKFFPNGYSKGIEDLLGLSRVNQNRGKRLKISITGGTQFEVETLNKLIQKLQLESRNLRVNAHLSHYQALQKMKELDVIVLPMPASKEYVGFPLKSIEALASGRIVVAAKCRVYTDIFVEDFQPYWYVPENPESLFMAITKALGDNDLEARITSGLKFAEQFTWDIRTKNLLSELKSGVQD